MYAPVFCAENQLLKNVKHTEGGMKVTPPPRGQAGEVALLEAEALAAAGAVGSGVPPPSPSNQFWPATRLQPDTINTRV